jgi:hypothetical protein
MNKENKMKTIPIYLFLIFIFTGCTISPSTTIDDSSQQKTPEWFINPPEVEGKMYAVGKSDNGKLLSLVNALTQLSEIVEVNIKIDTSWNSEHTSGYNIGDINISSLTKDYSQGQEGGIHEYFEHVKKVLYSKQNSSMLITEYYQQTDIGNNIQYNGNISITWNNANYSDIVKELESVGVVIKKTFQNNTHYYTLLELAELLSENMMKPKEVEEEKKALYEEFEKSIKKIKLK